MFWIMGFLVGKKLLLILRIIIFICVFSCMCLYCCWGVYLQCSQRATNRATSMVLKLFADYLETLQKRGMYKIVRAGHQGWSIRRGYWEDLTSSWPASWTWAIDGCLPVPLSLECTFCPPFPHYELFQGCSLERVTYCWDNLDCAHD